MMAKVIHSEVDNEYVHVSGLFDGRACLMANILHCEADNESVHVSGLFDGHACSMAKVFTLKLTMNLFMCLACSMAVPVRWQTYFTMNLLDNESVHVSSMCM
jgi:hypothetical protein